MANYGATLLTTRAHLQEKSAMSWCAILRPRLFYVLICISARARVPGTLVHFIFIMLSNSIEVSRVPATKLPMEARLYNTMHTPRLNTFLLVSTLCSPAFGHSIFHQYQVSSKLISTIKINWEYSSTLYVGMPQK